MWAPSTPLAPPPHSPAREARPPAPLPAPGEDPGVRGCLREPHLQSKWGSAAPGRGEGEQGLCIAHTPATRVQRWGQSSHTLGPEQAQPWHTHVWIQSVLGHGTRRCTSRVRAWPWRTCACPAGVHGHPCPGSFTSTSHGLACFYYKHRNQGMPQPPPPAKLEGRCPQGREGVGARDGPPRCEPPHPHTAQLCKAEGNPGVWAPSLPAGAQERAQVSWPLPPTLTPNPGPQHRRAPVSGLPGPPGLGAQVTSS